jgi:uncharacterized coiled-coil DUF342 family protein
VTTTTTTPAEVLPIAQRIAALNEQIEAAEDAGQHGKADRLKAELLNLHKQGAR